MSQHAYAPTAAPAAPALAPSTVLRALVATDDDRLTAVLRVTLGVVMFPHGMQKVFGWFGGYGFEGTMGYFTESMGIPWILALLAIAAEFLGSLGLITGLLARVAAFGIAVNMVVATLTSHVRNGFLMNWSGALPAGQEGYEYHVLAVALALVVMVRGSGAASLDRRLSRRPL